MTSVEKALSFPKWTRTPEDVVAIFDRCNEITTERRSMVDKAERDDRDLSQEELDRFETLGTELDRLICELPQDN